MCQAKTAHTMCNFKIEGNEVICQTHKTADATKSVKPTRRRAYDDIYALNKDFTLNFVGSIGHIAFHHPDYFDNDKLIRIDHSAYLSGAENYIVK